MSNNRVLIVDDDDSALALLSTILKLDNLEVLATTDPYDALRLARYEDPAIALLDIMMPKMDGFELCRKIREYPQLSMLPVFFVTAYRAVDLEKQAHASGADGTVQKPINIQEIRDLIRRFTL